MNRRLKPAPPEINNAASGEALEELVVLWQWVAETVDALFNAAGVVKDAFVEAGKILLVGFKESGHLIWRNI